MRASLLSPVVSTDSASISFGGVSGTSIFFLENKRDLLMLCVCVIGRFVGPGVGVPVIGGAKR